MAYVINKTDGTQVAVVEDQTLNTALDIGLIGKAYAGYGETLNENLVKLLENFANSTPPTKPIKGELWYDTQSKSLKVYDATWNPVSATVAMTALPPTVSRGELWFNTDTKQLFVKEEDFELIGPTLDSVKPTRVESAVLTDTSNVQHQVLKGFVNDELLYVIADTNFSTTDSDFQTVQRGVNLKQGVLFVGNLTGNALGNAATATKLKTPRKINGVSFDGTADISLPPTTFTTLSPGAFLTGEPFANQANITWNVNATPGNSPSTVVSRDYAGNFSAGVITAALNGNATTASSIKGGTANSLLLQADQNSTGFLAPGTAGTVLTMVNGAPVWAARPATTTSLGMVKVGAGLVVSADGTLSAGTGAVGPHTHSEYALSNHTHSQYLTGLPYHTHSEYASSSHSHSGFAPSYHTHSEYALSSHTHSGYASSSHTHPEFSNIPVLGYVTFVVMSPGTAGAYVRIVKAKGVSGVVRFANGKYTVSYQISMFPNGVMPVGNGSGDHLITFGRTGWTAGYDGVGPFTDGSFNIWSRDPASANEVYTDSVHYHVLLVGV